jgi:hypothetical protein
MTKSEKLKFILQQMRFCLLKKDYVRTQVISRKVNTKVFDGEEFHVRFKKLKIFGFACLTLFLGTQRTILLAHGKVLGTRNQLFRNSSVLPTHLRHQVY